MISKLFEKKTDFSKITGIEEFINALYIPSKQQHLSHSAIDHELENIVTFYNNTLTTAERRKEFIAELIKQKQYRYCILLRASNKVGLSLSLEEYKTITEEHLTLQEVMNLDVTILYKSQEIYIINLSCIIYILRDLKGEGIELSCKLLIRAMGIRQSSPQWEINDTWTDAQQLQNFLSSDTLYNNDVQYDLYNTPRQLLSICLKNCETDGDRRKIFTGITERAIEMEVSDTQNLTVRDLLCYAYLRDDKSSIDERSKIVQDLLGAAVLGAYNNFLAEKGTTTLSAMQLYLDGRHDILLRRIDLTPSLMLETKDDRGNTLLHLAILNKQQELTKVLLQICANNPERRKRIAQSTNTIKLTPIECYAAKPEFELDDISALVADDETMMRAMYYSYRSDQLNKLSALLKILDLDNSANHDKKKLIITEIMDFIDNIDDFIKIITDVGISLGNIIITIQENGKPQRTDISALAWVIRKHSGSDIKPLAALIQTHINDLLQVETKQTISPILFAALLGKKDLVEALLTMNGDLDKKQEGRHHPILELLYAATSEQGMVEQAQCAELIIPHLLEKPGNTLKLSILHTILNVLLRFQTDKRAEMTPRFINIINITINALSGSALNNCDSAGKSVATKLVTLKLYDALKVLTEKDGINIALSGPSHHNAIVEAFTTNDMDAIRLLNPTQWDKVQHKNITGATLLMLSLMHSDATPEIITIAKSMCQIKEQDKEGHTAWHYAVNGGTRSIEMLAQSKGAESFINTPDHKGRTPLMHAIAQGKQDVVCMLLSHGATVNMRDAQGNTALHIAVSKLHFDIVRELLKQPEVEINAANSDGIIPFHIAMLQAKVIQDQLEAKDPILWAKCSNTLSALQEAGAQYTFDALDESLKSKICKTYAVCAIATKANEYLAGPNRWWRQHIIAMATAYNIAISVKESVQKQVRAFLSKGTELACNINPPDNMVGAFSIRGWYRWVEYGDDLKKHMQNSSLYDADTLDSKMFVYDSSSDQDARLTSNDHVLMLNRYVEIMKTIENTPFIFFWTKWQLSSLATDVKVLDDKIRSAYPEYMINEEGEAMEIFKEIISSYTTDDLYTLLGKSDNFEKLMISIAKKDIILNNIALQAKIILLMKEERLITQFSASKLQPSQAISDLVAKFNDSITAAQIQELIHTSHNKFASPNTASAEKPKAQDNQALNVLSTLLGIKEKGEVIKTVSEVTSNVAAVVAAGSTYAQTSGISIGDMSKTVIAGSTIVGAAGSSIGKVTGSAFKLLSNHSWIFVPVTALTIAGLMISYGRNQAESGKQDKVTERLSKREISNMLKQSGAKASSKSSTVSYKPLPAKAAQVVTTEQPALSNTRFQDLVITPSKVDRSSKVH